MLTWLADEPTTAYLLLGVLALAAGMGWWMNRQGRYAVGFLTAAVLIGLVWLIGRFVVTDARRVHDVLQQMADAVAARRPAAILDNISDSFRLGRCGKEDFRAAVEHHVSRGDVADLRIRDYSVRELSRAGRSATVRFTVIPSGSEVPEGSVYRCEARFALDPDGRWRLQSFKLAHPPIDPGVGPNIEIPIPC